MQTSTDDHFLSFFSTSICKVFSATIELKQEVADWTKYFHDNHDFANSHPLAAVDYLLYRKIVHKRI